MADTTSIQKHMSLHEWPHTRSEACLGRKDNLFKPPYVVLNFELQRRFAANYLLRQCIPMNDHSL